MKIKLKIETSNKEFYEHFMSDSISNINFEDTSYDEFYSDELIKDDVENNIIKVLGADNPKDVYCVSSESHYFEDKIIMNMIDGLLDMELINEILSRLNSPVIDCTNLISLNEYAKDKIDLKVVYAGIEYGMFYEMYINKNDIEVVYKE